MFGVSIGDLACMSPEEQFLAQLELIDRVIGSICRRHCCFGADAEDFAGTVKVKLIDNDYAVIRKFQGKSLLATYLTTVIANLFRDYRIQKWGKWRSSAKARRLGTEAVQLEQLLYRDGCSFDEAARKLQGDFGVELSREELRKIEIELPRRLPRRSESDELLAEVAGDDRAERRALDRGRSEVLKRTETALIRALERLPAEDRLILKLRFEGQKVVRIAKILGLEQRPLYSRIEKNLKQLRASLETSGVTREEVRDVVGWDGFDIQVDYDLEEDADSEEDSEGDDGKQ